MITDAFVISVAAMLSLQFVVAAGRSVGPMTSLLVFLLGNDLRARRRGARHPARHPRHDHGPVSASSPCLCSIVAQLLLGSATPMESVPVWLDLFHAE